ncbi:hypothetical protein PENFLA_c036G00093 [Penicillium flavigenum]|uniref:Uncharacterized protein n=1 Tax=Penicillium flavigenum TaxID=254877 RepID=A0A1V6SKU4_9EURO|nr:hypothetical protein PENFLA_c036G00093 [Penicillium flavigenum]
MLIIGIRGMGIGMDVAVAVEDMAGVETERLGSGVGDLGDIISSCVDTPLRWRVAMSYGGGRASRSFSRRRRRKRKNSSARIRARPITETGTAMAIFVVFDGPPEKVVGSLAAVVSEAEAEIVVIWVDVRDDRFEIDDVAKGVGEGDGVVYTVASGMLVELASELILSTADVSLGVGYVVNSLTEGHDTVPGKIPVTGTAGSTQPDVSATFFWFPPGVVVTTRSWSTDATCEVGYSDLMGSQVSASSSPVPNIPNGKNLMADMVG